MSHILSPVWGRNLFEVWAATLALVQNIPVPEIVSSLKNHSHWMMGKTNMHEQTHSQVRLQPTLPSEGRGKWHRWNEMTQTPEGSLSSLCTRIPPQKLNQPATRYGLPCLLTGRNTVLLLKSLSLMAVCYGSPSSLTHALTGENKSIQFLGTGP